MIVLSLDVTNVTYSYRVHARRHSADTLTSAHRNGGSHVQCGRTAVLSQAEQWGVECGHPVRMLSPKVHPTA